MSGERRNANLPVSFLKQEMMFFLGSVKFFAGNIDETFLPNKLKPIIPKRGQDREEGSTIKSINNTVKMI